MLLIKLGNPEYFSILGSGIDSFKGEKSYYSTSSIQGIEIGEPEEIITYEARPSRANMQPIVGSVGFAKMAKTLKVLAIDQEFAEKSIVSTGFALIYGNPEKIDSEYLRYFFLSINFNSQKDKLSTGTTQVAINQKGIEKIEMPFFDINIQRLIVSEIEKQFSRLDEGLSSLLRIRDNLRSYRASLLKSAVEGRLTAEWRAKNPDIESADILLSHIRTARREKWISENLGKKYKEPEKVKEGIEGVGLSSNWCWSNGEELFDYITSGSRGWAKYYSNQGSLFLRMTNLDHNTLNLDLKDLQFVALPKNSTEGLRTRLQARDILISITADVGMIAQIPDYFEYEAYINQHVCLARPSLLLRNSYIGFLFISLLVQNQLKKSQRGATKVGLGLDDIRNLKIPLPPLLEQHRIVEMLEENFSVIDSLESLVNANIRRAENLKQAILKKAFNGELITE